MSKLILYLKKIPRNALVSAAFALSDVIQKCIGIITLMLFLRLMSQDEYGRVTIYVSWMSIVTIFSSLNLPYGSFSRAMIKYENDRESYVASCEGLCLLMTLIILCLYLPFRELWNRLFGFNTAIMILMFFEIFAMTSLQLWNSKKKFEFRCKGIIFVSFLLLFTSTAFQLFLVTRVQQKAYALIVANSIVTIIIGSIIFLFNIVKGKTIFKKEYWKFALGFNLPLLLYYLSQTIFNQSDRIMIGKMCGDDKAAAYAVAYNVGMLLNFLLIAINNTYTPWFFNALKQGKQQESKSVTIGIALLMSFLLLCVSLFAPEGLYIMAGSEKYNEYYAAIWVIPPVVMSVMLLYFSQLSINYAFYYEKKKTLILSSCISASANIILNAIFIPLCGFIIAGYTTLISYVLFALLNYVSMKKILKEQSISDCGYAIKTLVSIFFAFSLLVCMTMLIYKFFVLRVVCFLILFLVFLGVFGLYFKKGDWKSGWNCNEKNSL